MIFCLSDVEKSNKFVLEYLLSIFYIHLALEPIYKDKRKCDLYGKKVQNNEDTDLCKDCESRDKMVWRFVFKRDDKNGGGAKNSIIFDRGIAGQSKDNSVLLIC